MLDGTSGEVLSGNRWPGLKSLTEAVGIRPLIRPQSLDFWQTVEKGSCPCAALTYDHVETWRPPIIVSHNIELHICDLKTRHTTSSLWIKTRVQVA